AGGIVLQPGTNVLTVTAQDATGNTTTVTLTVTLVQAFPLTVSLTGTGAGEVTSTPNGIECGETCSASYVSNSVITLTASPAAGSAFTGWSGGGCSGTATCTVTMSAATTVSATFVATLPTVPLHPVDTGMPATSTTVTVCPSACDFSDLQLALDTVPLGTRIILTAGVAYSGPFTVPNKTSGTGWIVIQSSAIASLPAPRNRVAPAHAPKMPRIIANGFPPIAIQTATGAHHYRLVGLEIAAGADTSAGLLRLGDSGETVLANQAHHIIVDRNYIHGDGVHNVRRGIAFDLANGAIVDSYLSDFVDSAANAQAIVTTNAPGPLGVYNTYLEAAGQNIVLGGADPSIPNLIPSDIHIEGNYFSKPVAWLAQPWVTNVIDLQNAQRVLFEHNVL